MKRLFTSGIIILAFTFIAVAQPKIKSAIEYYEIRGSTVNELR